MKLIFEFYIVINSLAVIIFNIKNIILKKNFVYKDLLSIIIMSMFICKYCTKEYKSYNSLYSHIVAHHSEQKTQDLNKQYSDSKLNKCSICKLQLNNKSAKYRHEKKCKEMIIIEQKIREELSGQIDTLRKKKEEEEKNLENIIKEKNKIEKEISSIKKTSTDDKIESIITENRIYKKLLSEITTKQNINNGTINNGPVVYNNTINIVKFGSEELKDIFTQDEKLKILNRKRSALEQSIEMLHLNKKKPEFKNIFITNLKDDYAYVYDGEKFIAAYKTEVLNDIIDNHSYNIETSMEEYKDKIAPKTYEVLQKFVDMMNDETTEFYAEPQNKKYDNYKEYKKDMIKLLIYNNTYMDGNLINVIYE